MEQLVEEKETFESRELFVKAENLIRKGDYKRAAVLVNESLRISPDNPLYLSAMGLCCGMQGKLLEGENMCRKALSMSDGKEPLLLVNLGRVLLGQGARKEARSCFSKAYALDNTNSPAALELSRMGVRKKQVLTFLDRDNPLNIYLGRIRYRIMLSRKKKLKKL